ncbi:hypothetical protein EYR38_003323 [Pleurotus pulmonarius]|nr:hypothetical protein EYR38_003323 [Pleurotus pulmonarius]
MGEINDLPVELFSLVLKYLVHHDIGTPGNYQWYGDPVVLDVLSVAQVCTKWRQIALNTPSLWTTLNDVLHPFVIEYALEHSSNLPLKVYLDFRWYFPESDSEDEEVDECGDSDDNGGDALQWQALQKLASQIPRTSHFVARFYQGYAYSLLPFLSHDAPLLERFEIDNEDDPISNFEQLILPPTIFNGNCPSLRHLVLRCSEIQYDSPVLPNLTTLMLIWSTWESASRLLQMLSRLERLETLHFTGVFEADDSGELGTVVLPKLRQLSLIDIVDVNVCTLLLNRLKCPHASLRIILREEPTENLMNLFPACMRWLSFHDVHGVIDNLKIDGGHFREDLQLEGFSSTEPAFRFSITISEEFQYGDEYSDDEDDAGLEQIIAAALLELPLDNVHTLHFYARTCVSHQFWATILSTAFLNLRTVEVCPLSARAWSEIMAWCATSGSNYLQGVQEVVFLAVVVLILSAGSLVLSHPATARDVDVSDATFPGCNPEQIATLQRAIAVATLFQQDAWAFVLFFPAALNNATLIAPVEICKAFWSRNGSDDQNGQTLFHEATHFHSRGMLGTNHAVAEDYGTEYSLALARDAPTDAIRNADNYAYFAQYPVGP